MRVRAVRVAVRVTAAVNRQRVRQMLLVGELVREGVPYMVSEPPREIVRERF